MIKGQWPRSKVSHCDLIVVPFGPFKNRPLFLYLGTEFTRFVWEVLKKKRLVKEEFQQVD